MIPQTMMAGMSLLGGITGSRGSKKEAKRARELQEAMFAFQQKRYNDFKQKYGGIEDALVADANKGVTADLAGVTNRAAADVATQFGNAEDARLRNMQRMGINPNSGRADALAARNAVAQSLASAGNITTGREAERRNAEQQTYDRRKFALNFGAGQMSDAMAGMTNATNNMTNIHSNAAAQQGAQAGSFFGAAGDLIGGMIGSGKAAGATPTASPVAGISLPQYLPPSASKAQAATGLVDNMLSGKIPGLSAYEF